MDTTITVTLALAVGIPTATIVAFFLRMDWQVGRVVEMLKNDSVYKKELRDRLERLDRRIDKLAARWNSLEESDR